LRVEPEVDVFASRMNTGGAATQNDADILSNLATTEDPRKEREIEDAAQTGTNNVRM
jgi:hypothetical protein